MISSLLVLSLLLPQGGGSEAPILRAGVTLEGQITDEDPVVHTPTLDTSYTNAPVVGKHYRIEVDSAGPYTIQLRSHLFDAYLVLRDAAGEILAEDDDGAVGSHARITAELDPASLYRVEACALHGARGTFELRLIAGGAPEPSPLEERALELEDLAQRVRVLEEHAPDSPALMRALHDRSEKLRDAGRYEEAQVACGSYMALTEKLIGPDSPEMAHALGDKALLLKAQGAYANARPHFERALARPIRQTDR